MSQRTAQDALWVIDAGTMTARPFGETILADLRTDVIKIEEPRAGDPMRDWPQIKDGRSLWKVTGRNKKLILDLSVPRAKELFLCLERAEAVIGSPSRHLRVAWR